MINTSTIIVLTSFITGIGFATLLLRHRSHLKASKFTRRFRDSYIKFVGGFHKGSFDSEEYSWLTMNVNRMQNELGILGIMDYVGAGHRYRVPRYQIVINTLPKFRMGTAEPFDINSVDDCLLRQLGFLEEETRVSAGNLMNPIIWFREGIRTIIGMPLLILEWFGFIQAHSVYSINP